MSAQLASENTEYGVVDSEPPEVLARNLSAAGYLLAGATAFFFLAFLFAFFYLRSIDQKVLWKPHGVNPSLGWGTAIVACWVASAVLVRLAGADQLADRRAQWRLKGLVAFVLAFAGLVLQVLAWAEQGFGPTDGAYASVYVGWTAFMALFVVGTLFWLETTLATSWRYRNEPGDDATNMTASVTTLGFYWTFLAGIGVVAWAVLYLVA